MKLRKLPRTTIQNICRLLTGVIFIMLIMLLANINAYAGNKKILALYKSTENFTENNNPIKNQFHEPLRELGWQVEYLDAVKPLPGYDTMKQYQAVITYHFTPEHPEPSTYLHWLKEQPHHGRKIIILGNLGAHTKDNQSWIPLEELNDLFHTLGLSCRGTVNLENDKASVKIPTNKNIYKNPPETASGFLLLVKPVGNTVISHLDVTLPDKPATRYTLAATSPAGAFIHLGFLNDPGNTDNWYFDRKAFLKEVLTDTPAAIPDFQKLLALYKKSEKDTSEDNLIRKLAREPLFKLGYELDFHNIEESLPEPETMKRYRGIVTWFTGPEMTNAPRYIDWLADQINDGKKIIILGNFGAFADVIKMENITTTRFLDEKELNNFFYPFGLRMDGLWTSNPELVRIDTIDPAVISEKNLEKLGKLNNYFRYHSVEPKNRAYLSLKRTDLPDSKSDVVVVTPRGGFALQGYIYTQDKDWNISYITKLPEFLEKCLEPAPTEPLENFELTVDIKKELERAAAEQQPITITPPEGKPILRRILALYKGSETNDYTQGMFFTFTGPILNHLGVTVDYHNIEQSRPDDEEMAKYRGIVTWFEEPGMENAKEYNDWILHQLDRGRKLVILGNYGAFYERENFAYASNSEKVLERIGLEMSDEYRQLKTRIKTLNTIMLTMQPSRLGDLPGHDVDSGRTGKYHSYLFNGHITYHDKNMVNFEAPFKLTDDTFVEPVKSISENNIVALRIRIPEMGEINPVVIGEWGGCAMGDFMCRLSHDTAYIKAGSFSQMIRQNHKMISTEEVGGKKWVLNPFTFFTKALALDEVPKLDYTTLNGQRIFYSHIDGDGLLNPSEINPAKRSGEIILEEILQKYNLPVTASIITEEVEKYGKKYYNRPLIIGRKIFALPNVEIGSHTHSHPFNYTKGDVEISIEKNTDNTRKKYTIENKLPDPEKEILYSTALINQNIAPDGKKNKIVLWSGLCNPSEEFLKYTEKLNLENINGGNPIYAGKDKSYSYLPPVYWKKGNYLQIHTAGSNDYIYTSAWTQNFGGMRRLLDHIKDTESPRRMLPINIYYHYYSAMYPEGLESLKILYDYVRNNETAPLFAADYSKIIKDFYAAEIAERPDESFVISTGGKIRTVRFDNTGKSPDLKRSRGVIGFTRHNESLYIFLDESKHQILYLTDELQNTPYLKSASHYISRWKIQEDTISAVLTGIGPGTLKINNLKQNTRYAVTIGENLREIPTDETGTLTVKYEFQGKPRDYNLEITRR